MKLLALLSAVFALALGVTAASGDDIPCASGCRIHLTATEEVRHWESAPRAAWDDRAWAKIGVSVEGHWLELQPWSRCGAQFSGHGVVVRFKSCGSPTQVFLRWVALRGERHVTIYLQAGEHSVEAEKIGDAE